MRTIAKNKQGLFLVAFLSLSTFLFSQKYWVGGAGQWSDASHWSDTNGGQGGAGSPNYSEDAIFTNLSGLQSNDNVKIDSIGFVRHMDFSGLNESITLIGDRFSNLMVTGNIHFAGKVINEISGYVVLTGSNSNYILKEFQPGEFYGKTGFDDILKSKRSEGNQVQLQAVTTIDTTIVDATCGCNGSITVTPLDGTGPFNYQWFPNGLTGDGTNTITNVCPGKYNVIITDLSDLVPAVFVDLEVEGPSPLTINHLITDSVNCFGGSDGFISTLIFGGTSPYTIDWQDASGPTSIGQSTATATGLSAGDYQVQVTDDVGCVATSAVYTVEEPTALSSSITDTTHITCNSLSNGDATVTATGGSPAYTYDWYNAGNQTTTIATGLSAGTYNVEVTDSRGCLDTSEVTITEPTALVASASRTNVVCFGDGDGTATASASGGTPAYLYDWYDHPSTPTSPSISNLDPGTYNVEITDDNGCLDTAQVVITEPSLLTSSITDTVHVLCNSLCTGEIEVTAAGGTPGYTYLWYDASNETTDRVTNMCAGTYNVRVRDDNGCLDTSTVTLVQPLTAITTSITDTTHNLCWQDCDGIAIVTPVGGTSGYTYDWYDGSGGTDSTENNLCAGTYNVEVTDANGCKDTSTVTITEPTELTGSTSLTMVDCKDNCSGEIDLTPSGGTSAYTFDWYDVPSTPTSEDVTGLCDGTYNVEITDANGCLDTITATITEPDSLIASIAASTNVLCKDLCTGSMSVTQTGGTAGYTYDWYDHPSTPTSATVNNVCDGTYNVEVTDNNGCLDTAQVIITEPALALSSSITDTVHILCKDMCTGEAEVTAAGGTGGYIIDWYDVPGTPTVVRATDLCDGTYHVEITDGNGCLDTSEVIITEPAAGLVAAINDSVNATCNGFCDAKALVTYSGGTAGYTIDWYTAGNQATDTAYNLCAGTHYVEVTDNNGCIDTTEVIIIEPQPLVITINSATLPTCYGDCDGVMSVTPSGSTAPYTFLWYDVVGTPTTSSVNGQCAGGYNVRVEDAVGCNDTALVILSEPDSLEHTIDSQTNLSCKNECVGDAAMTPIGGIPGYTVTWYNVPGTPTGTSVSNLCAGTWNFELEDSQGCKDSGEVIITEPALELTSSITDTTHNVCFGECNGDATVTAAGGTGLITYDWYDSPDGDTDVQAENLCAGTFNVEVSDANGCLDTSSVVITEPTDISFTTATENIVCGGTTTGSASVSVSGGVSPYTYDWYDAGNQTNDTVTSLAAGTYHCEITDANGCLDTAEVTITEPIPLIAGISNDTIHNSCFGECIGYASRDFTGGVSPRTYSWYDVPGTPTSTSVSNLCAGTYHLEITDASGCKDTAEFEIREPTLLVITADSTDAACAGVCDGRTWTDYSGGTSPYNISWYDMPGTPTGDTVNSVCAGTYNVEITDDNGCKDTATTTVNVPVVVTTSITDTTHNVCSYDCAGEAIVTPAGGTSPYTYDWYNVPGGDTDSTGSNLCVGTFNVEVTDNNGCVDTAEVTITSSSPPLTPTTDSILTSCVGSSDGAAIVDVSGGVGPYTLDWYDAGNQTTDTATGLSAGTYHVEITDALGCIDTAEAIVTDPDTLRANISDTTHVLCFDDSTGIAIVTPAGGTAGFTFNWYDTPNNETDSTATGLPDGTYHVEVTDAKGCLDTGIVTITQSTDIILGTDSIQATCTGICTGSAIVNPSGGSGSYTFDWYDAGNQTDDTATALCADTFHVEVTDAFGCIDTAEVIVTEPVTITASQVDVDSTTCPGGSDGQAVVAGAGGTLPYSYWWSDALNQTNDTATGLSAATYQAAVTDFNGCSDTVDIIVEQPDPITPIDSLVNISCKDVCDGYIKLTVTGGNGVYTHSWSNGSSSNIISSLCDGVYSDTITDGIGCVDTFTYTITEPDSLYAPITDTIHVSCFSSTNGQAIVTPTGGTPVYTYDWYDAGNDADSVASGLSPGTYHVEVTDANGCVDTGEVTIQSPPVLVLSTDSVEATCSGICDGIAIVNVTGGTTPYSYDWFTSTNQDNDSIYNVCADTFRVEVTDGNGCIDTAVAIVTQPISVVASITDTVNASCNSGSDAWAVVGGTGGTTPYTYWWTGGSSNDTITGLTAGTYRAAVTDVNGCSDTTSITITEPTQLVPVIDSTHASCYTFCDGRITITPVGGTSPYTHAWSTGSTASTIINLCADTYIDTITDGNGCQEIIDVIVSEPDSLEAQPSIFQNVQCFGDSTGIVRGLGNGGTAPYSFEWNGDSISAAGDFVNGFWAGLHQVIVTDINGCVDTNNFMVSEPTQLTSSITDTVHANCVCNAAATVTPSGGTAGYTYLWNDLGAQTDSTAIGLCTGNYEVVVTDANGCLDTTPVTIRDTSLFSVSITDTTHASCFGMCDGSAIVTPNLGTAPFTYAWTDPGATTDSTVNGLCAGSVSVTVTDGEGCIRFASVTIQEPNSVVGTPMFTSPTCYGLSDAVVWVDVTGGTGPYTHAWDTTSVNDTVYTVGIGTYTDTITDANGCMDTVSVIVTEPDSLAANLDSSNVLCNGSGDGLVYSATTGGTLPYTYLWNDIAATTNDTASNLDPGTYTVVVTDGNGCTVTDSISVTEPPVLTSSITDTSHVSCLCTGVASVTPTGGTAPYTYLWNDLGAQTDSTATGLCAGNYEVQVTDANGCLDTSIVTIRDTSNFITSIVDTNMATCNGICDGSALARADNGVQPYVFTWNDPAATIDSSVSGLCAGNYTVTIADAIGCTHNLNVTITEPDPISITISDTSVTCNTFCDGKAVATISGGTTPYTVLWDDPDATDSIYVDSLCPGAVTITVTDSNSCVETESVTITEPAELIAFISPFNHITCNGDNDGSVNALPTGGTAPYTYLWNTTATTQGLSNLGPGLYSVMVTDTNGCQDDTSVTIIEPTLLTSSITDTTHILCGGQATGVAIVTPGGGTAPYSYDWYDAPGSQTDSTASNLPAGTYNVEVRDANGCRDTSIVTITEPTVFSASITNQTATSCLVCDGTAFVTPVGGVTPYTYSWYNAPNTETDSSATGLCASLYNVLVTDANGCSEDVSLAIVGPGGLTAGVYDTTMITCNGACDGLAVATGVAGTAPYNYTWDDPAVTLNDSVADLCPGTYNVTVQDAAGCLAYASVDITEPSTLVATVTDTNATGCFSPCSGDATVSAVGGTGPYSYSWDDWASQSTATATGLCAAQYIATVTDANGCQDTAIGFITGPGGLTVSIDSIVDVTCNGNCDGKAAFTPQGGVPGYTYLWNDPTSHTDTVISTLCAGNYVAQVTDANNCVAFANVSINEPAELVATMADSSDVTCNGGSDGWAYVTYVGGSAPHTVQWNDAGNQTTDTATGLTAGTYTVTITDSKGCTDQISITIGQPTAITATTSNVQHVACTGFCIGQATLSVSGGTVGSGYTYLWSPSGQTSPAATGLCSGWQTYTVTDGNNCTLVDSVQILDLNNFSVAMSGTGVSCNGDCDGTVLATPTGGTAPYTHSWTNGVTTTNQSNLCPGIYIDTVFDFNGCFYVDSFEVIEPTIFDVAIVDSSNLRCFNVCDGYAFAQGSGGTGAYQYTWYNSPGGQVNDTAYNLCAATYYVYGEDANGCSAEDTITLTQPAAISGSIDAQSNVTCFGACNGSATISATGGSGALSFDWGDGNTSLSRTGLCANNFNVTVTDDSSCTATINVNITEPDSLIAIITDTTHIVCATVCDGDATVGQTGGTGPFTYDWYDVGNSSASQITNQCVGTYHVEVTDANGCIDTAEVTINNINVLSATLATTNISCFGECDGKLIAQPSGGIPPYTYLWNTGSLIDSIDNLCQNNYFVTITDNNLCQVTVAGGIIEPALLTSAIVDSSNLDCFGICDGYATVSPSGGTGPYTYQWDDVASQTSIMATGLCAQTYKVVVTDANGCLDSTNAYLTQPTQITSSIVETQANCTNTADGSADITASGGTGLLTFSWTGPNSYSSINEDPTLMGIGEYHVTVTDANGCTHEDTATITELFVVNADAGNDTTICNQDTLLLVGSGGDTYSWNVGVNNDSITVAPSTTTDYILTVFNNGCTDQDTVTVNVNALPNIQAIANDYLILEGNSALLTASGAGIGGTYDWNPPTTLSDPTFSTPTATPLETTTYFVTGTDINGCIDSASVTITVATSIVFPDGITPNGDGLNDTWRIELIEEFPENVVQVYNRWGQLVFESKGYLDQWDGLHNGKELPVGTYYYLIDLGPDMPKYTGPITLMR